MKSILDTSKSVDLSIKTHNPYYDYELDNFTETEIAAERFVQTAMQLQGNEHIGFELRFDDDGSRQVSVFFKSDVTITQEDLNWIFHECAVVEDNQSNIISDICSGKRLYALSKIQHEKSSEHQTKKTKCFKDIHNALREFRAAIRIVQIGGEDNEGMVLFSFSDEITLRMRTMISMTFESMTISDISHSEDLPNDCLLSAESISSCLSGFLNVLVREPSDNDNAADDVSDEGGGFDEEAADDSDIDNKETETTYTVDCISKKKKRNNGERAKYYVENNHPAIIDRATFGKVQEEIARRSGLRKVKQVGTKTELGKYSSKYALTELLVCGECGTPYRRCTWTACGNKRIVWRCISRLDYGKKHCHNSPTMSEEDLHRAIMSAVKTVAMQNTKLLQTLKTFIAMTVKCDDSEDRKLEIKVRLAEINEEFQKAMSLVSVDDDNNLVIEQRLTELIMEKEKLNKELAKYSDDDSANSKSKVNEIDRLTDILENQPLQFNDELIRQMLQCVVVESKDRIKVIFNDGTEIEQPIL